MMELIARLAEDVFTARLISSRLMAGTVLFSERAILIEMSI